MKKRPHWPSYARTLKREAKRTAENGNRDFDPLLKRAGRIDDVYYRSQALAWIARRMTCLGLDGTRVFSKAVKAATRVEPDWRRAEILVQVGSEMTRAGAKEFGALFSAIEGIDNSKHRKEALQVVRRRMARAGIESPKTPQRKRHSEKKELQVKELPGKKGRKKITLGLLNTYTAKTLQDAHIRAIARAAPLCYAFDLNLYLFGFPVGGALEAISMVERTTRVGGGRYLRRLFEEGRFFVHEIPKVPVLKGVGELVATTSSPDPKKRAELAEITGGDNSFCFLMGLGSRGLPKGVLRTCRRHLELTGEDIPLETCTAMGVLAALSK